MTDLVRISRLWRQLDAMADRSAYSDEQRASTKAEIADLYAEDRRQNWWQCPDCLTWVLRGVLWKCPRCGAQEPRPWHFVSPPRAG